MEHFSGHGSTICYETSAICAGVNPPHLPKIVQMLISENMKMKIVEYFGLFRSEPLSLASSPAFNALSRTSRYRQLQKTISDVTMYCRSFLGTISSYRIMEEYWIQKNHFMRFPRYACRTVQLEQMHAIMSKVSSVLFT